MFTPLLEIVILSRDRLDFSYRENILESIMVRVNFLERIIMVEIC